MLPDRDEQIALQPSSPSLFSRLASNHVVRIELMCLFMLTGAACTDRRSTGAACTDRRSAATLGLSAMQRSVDIKSMLSGALCCR